MDMRRQARRLVTGLTASARILVVAALGSTLLYAQEAPEPVATTADAGPTLMPEPATLTPNVNVGGEATPVTLLVGRSTLIDIGASIARVSLTSSDVADALVTAPSQLLLHGKEPGSISMLVWSRGGAITRFEVAVERNLAALNEQVEALFPTEDIQVDTNGLQVVLSGRVSSEEVIGRASNLAAGFVGGPEAVVNLLQLREERSNQVLLRVRFAEVSRNALTELGASFFTSPTGVRNTVGRLTTNQFGAPTFSELEWSKSGEALREFGRPVESASGKIEFQDFLNLFLLSERYDLGLMLRALENQGLFQSLAEPNLVAESGKESEFSGRWRVPDSHCARFGQRHSRYGRLQGVRHPPELHAHRRRRYRPPQGAARGEHAGLRQCRNSPGLSHSRADDEAHGDRAFTTGRPDVCHCRSDQQRDELDDAENSLAR